MILRLILLAAISLPVFAQVEELNLAGDFRPRTTTAPYPETGIWFNPDEPGSGFIFEVQNSVLAGYYFGYDENGDQAWYLISGSLELLEEDGVVWRLEAPLLRYEDGSCIGCPYQGPSDPATVGEIRLEFSTRTTGRFSVDGGQWHRTQTFTFGTVAKDVFPGTDYRVPDLQGQWVMIRYDREKELDELSRKFAAGGIDVWITMVALEPGLVYYSMDQARGIEFHYIADVECVPGPDDVGGDCTLRVAQPPLEAKEYYMPASAISDSYFKAIADDGDTFEAFRVNYD